MKYNFIVKNEKQLKRKHHLDNDEGDKKWWKNKNELYDHGYSYLIESEVGLIYYDMKREKGGFSNIGERSDFIPSWAIHKFLTPEKDSEYFI